MCPGPAGEIVLIPPMATWKSPTRGRVKIPHPQAAEQK